MNDEGKGHAHPPSTLLLVMGSVIMLALLFCVMSINTCNKHLGQCRDEISKCQEQVLTLKKRTGCASRGAVLSVPKELFDLTVRIRVEGVLGGGIGSGVIVSKDSMLTNFHVIAGVGQLGGTVWVDLPNGKSLVCSVVKVDMARDLALVQPVDKTVLFDKWVEVAKDIPNAGESLITIGAANGNPPVATQGFFAYANAEGLYQMSLIAFFGNSGGPVFNADGKLVGLLEGVDRPAVIRGKDGGPPIVIFPIHLTFAIPSGWIADFLAGR